MPETVAFGFGRSTIRIEESVGIWRARVRALAESGMSANARCAENGVEKSTLFRRLERFRDEELDVFGGREAVHAADSEVSACAYSLVETARANDLRLRARLEWALSEMPRLGEPRTLSDVNVARLLP